MCSTETTNYASTTSTKKTKRKKIAYDSPWKNVLDRYFSQLMALCYPKYYAVIDWTSKYEPLDKELCKVMADAAEGSKIADKLMKVYLLDGRAGYVLVHVEVQATKEREFARRMYIYYCRIQAIHIDATIISLAVLLDRDPDWRPGPCVSGLLGLGMQLNFAVLKVLDYKDQVQALEHSNNPFAVVLLVQLAAMESCDAQAKLVSKTALARSLYKRGFGKDDIINLLDFINWVIRLPEGLSLKFNQNLRQIEESLGMHYVTSFEREAKQQGMQQGMQQGLTKGERELLTTLLQYKFGNLPRECMQTLERANSRELLRLGERVLDCQSLDEVFAEA